MKGGTHMQALHADRVERIASPEVTGTFVPDHEPACEYPLALVEWQDAWFDHDQVTVGDRRPDYLVRTVGFLIDEGPGVVSIAQELLPDGEGFRAVTHIPAAVIQRIVRIGPNT